MIVFLLNVAFYAAVIAYTIVFVITFSPILWIVRLAAGRRETLRLLRFFILHYGKVILYVLARPFITVTLVDHAGADEQGPFVYVSNHRAASDAFLIGVLSGEIVQVVNTWPFRLPILGMCAKLAGYLSVREMPFEEFSKRASLLLAEGVSIAGFPEGTRSGKATMGQFHGSLFRVAAENKAMIVPICMLGNENKPSRGTLIMQPGTVTVYRMAGIPYEQYKDLAPFALKNMVREKIAAFAAEHEHV